MDKLQNLSEHRILGIDPGSRIVGFALLEAKGRLPKQPRDFRVAEMGVLKADTSLSFTERIGFLHLGLCRLIEISKPTVCVMEKAFLGPNVQSALKLGEARGALLSALTRFNLEAFELSPTSVKQYITGLGHASKAQVSLALKALIGVQKGSLPYDATDALALALAFGIGVARQ